MLALAINLLFVAVAVAALLTLVDTALKARRAYDGLMREKALMDAGFVMQVAPREVRLRAADRRAGVAMLPRRTALLRPQPVLARGAA
ncbi:hypothetical protein OIK40_14180 [Erythrobacter sp. sf7]|uniref:Histidine kinase n=1 Tax=Erythrobacter fulvus TaxID=2987523 RepID=A0ABT5JT46_9SPHN|nr:hypothetical protein [Erythrobacter fulvus]MDC8755794.1 hypothetical protein [Erythrobacter fulvus]